MNEDITKRNRMLLIVDPQIDFITGTLPVPGAPEAMDALARYVKDHGVDYRLIFITCDRHPLRHSSFKEFGGEWPPHCIESSVGAAVWPALMEQLIPLSEVVKFGYKGEELPKDEYSIFQTEKGSAEIKAILSSGEISHIDICGLAGDVCVKNTLDDLHALYPHIPTHLLNDFTAYLSSGS